MKISMLSNGKIVPRPLLFFSIEIAAPQLGTRKSSYQLNKLNQSTFEPKFSDYASFLGHFVTDERILAGILNFN
jgi:hypothetical protein